MSILDNLKTDAAIQGETDSVGMSYAPVESGIYNVTIKLAFYTIANSGALCLNVHFQTKEGQEIRQQFYMTSGTTKGCKNYYVDKDGKKQYLPGFNIANALAYLTVGKEIGQLSTEPKVVKLYDFTKRQEVPTKVEMYTDLLNRPVAIGVIKQTVDKKTKDEATGQYVPTGEYREENEVDKIFGANDGATISERRGKSPGVFYKTWLDKWKGQTRDKRDKDFQVSTGSPSAGTTLNTAPATPELLFS